MIKELTYLLFTNKRIIIALACMTTMIMTLITIQATNKHCFCLNNIGEYRVNEKRYISLGTIIITYRDCKTACEDNGLIYCKELEGKVNSTNLITMITCNDNEGLKYNLTLNTQT